MDKNNDRLLIMSLDDIMGDRFGRYAKYIIQDRALPDVRDGLKPVQRRILYAMYKEGNLPTKPYRKSAKTVGNVIGNYHPHGDSSVYEAMVRLSQEWKMRMPLVDMQGNNGSIDNDPAAAMRYTEARLAPIALELLNDIDKDTVAMTPNFDDTEYEPTVLPAKYPNLLVNGATGISAGYATDIPPHNLGEVIDATIYRIRHPHCSFDQLADIIQGPDFPTGGICEGKDNIRQALKTGRGKVVVRARCEIVEGKSINQIVCTEIPYEVNKADMVRKIDEIRFNKTADGIIEVRDESDRNGLRVVVDLKKDVDAHNILNYLYKNTDLSRNYNYNMVAIKDKRPYQLGIEGIIDGYIDHEIEVVTRASRYDLDKANARMHIVEGLIKAVSILDDVVRTIRKSKDKADAKVNLCNAYGFTEKQAEAIVTLQLYRLTNTDIVALENERDHLALTINHLENILASEKVLRGVIVKQLQDIKEKYPSPRLTGIHDDVTDTSVDAQAMIVSENCYVSVTRDGYIKKISERSFKASEGTPIGRKADDYLVSLHHANTLNTLLCFTNAGNYTLLPVHKLEDFRWKDLGKHMSYLVKLPNDEKIINTLLVESFDTDMNVVIATRLGNIKRVAVKDLETVRYSKPMRCMNLKKGDSVVSVGFSNGHKGILMGSKAGYATLFDENEVSVQGKGAGGVKGMNVANDEVSYMRVFDPMKDEGLMIFTKPCGLKRLHLADIPAARRGAKGVIVCRRPKTKQVDVIDGFIMNTNDVVHVISGDIDVDIAAKDYAYVATSSAKSAVRGLKDDIDFVFQDNPQVAQESAKKNDGNNDDEGSAPAITPKDVEPPTLFDEDDELEFGYDDELDYEFNDDEPDIVVEEREPVKDPEPVKTPEPKLVKARPKAPVKEKQFSQMSLEDLLDDDDEDF